MCPTTLLPIPLLLSYRVGLWFPCWTYPVLQPMPPSRQVHVPGVAVIEAALAELAAEADHLPLVAAHLGQSAAQSPTGHP